MKVELKKDGILKISVDNELESYALKRWAEKNNDDLDSGQIQTDLEIDFEVPERILCRWELPFAPYYGL